MLETFGLTAALKKRSERTIKNHVISVRLEGE